MRRECVGGDEESCGCLGTTLIEEECNTHDCIIEWSQWAAWSECTVSCGGGRRERSRECNDPSLQACPGISKDYIGCNTQQCPFWGQWGPWSPCMKFCDSGLKTRNRNCFGGQHSECTGETDEFATETISCTNVTLNNIGCSGPGNKWTNWTVCTNCDGGSSTRSRPCRRYFDSETYCDDVENQEKICNPEDCPRCPANMGLGKKSILKLSCSKENVGGSTCQVSCPGGFKLKGVNTVTCLPNGMWSYKKKPSCTNTCLPRSPTLIKYQKRVCPQSCKLDKDCLDNTKKCNCDGSCGRTCSDPHTNCNGNIFKYNLKAECTQSYRVGSLCRLSCEKDQVLAGVKYMSCQSDGMWDRRVLPVCREANKDTNCRLRQSRHDKCCGRKSFDSKRQFCCRGVILYKSYGANECCNGKPYHTRNAICCGNKIYNKRLYGCCGGEAYRSGWSPRCCGGIKLYDIYTHYCTEKQIVQPVQPGVLPTFNFKDEEEE